MVFPALTINAQLSRGLLATVFVLSSLCHGAPCCCSSLSCGESQGEDCCSAEDECEGCCCQHAPDEDAVAASCCSSNTLPQSCNSCQGSCHCVAIPVAEGIVAASERTEKRNFEEDWPTDFRPIATLPGSIASGELRAEHQFGRDPCAHNRLQASLCVWRN